MKILKNHLEPEAGSPQPALLGSGRTTQAQKLEPTMTCTSFHEILQTKRQSHDYNHKHNHNHSQSHTELSDEASALLLLQP